MVILITKKSGKKFPPPFSGNGKTALAIGIVKNEIDSKHRDAFLLSNGKYVNCDKCKVLGIDLETESNLF